MGLSTGNGEWEYEMEFSIIQSFSHFSPILTTQYTYLHTTIVIIRFEGKLKMKMKRQDVFGRSSRREGF